MLLKEVNWIRLNSHKFCPVLRKASLEWYRPPKIFPCLIQKPLKFFKQRWRKLPVIVQLKETRNVELSFQQLAASTGCRVKKEIPLINSFATKVNAKSLQSLVQNENVKKIWYDREVKAVLDVASSTVQARPLWDEGITGKGVTVAVLDTGIYNHPDLYFRIKGFRDLVNQRNIPYDDNGHGTHVAGDIASSGGQSNHSYRGPAPEAELVGVKVLDKNGSGSLSTVIQGVQWCIDKKDALNIRVINLSLGTPATESYVQDPICQAVEKAWQTGIVVCAAAGNDGPDSRTINSPGIDPLVITVGALDDINTVSPGDDRPADFSSRGPTVDNMTKPDVLAPGTNVVSLRSPRSMLDRENPDARVGIWYTSLSGTSMATPVCAGVVAQIIQARDSITPDEVKTALTSTARTLNLDPNIQGAGVIDVQSALGKTTPVQ